MNINEIVEPLESLYGVTKLDWDLRLNLSLTEPFCPKLIIQAEDTNFVRYSAWTNKGDILENVKLLVDKIVHEIIERKGPFEAETNPYFTNPDDEVLNNWIVQAQDNPNLEFPYQFFYDRAYAKLDAEYAKERIQEGEALELRIGDTVISSSKEK